MEIPPTLMKMSCHLVAVDLDNTLLRSDHTLAPQGAKRLAEAARQGVTVVLSTTRNIYSARAFAQDIGLQHPIICSNGAQIWAAPTGPMWVNRTVPLDIAEAVIQLADARGWPLVTTVGEMTYVRQRPGQALGAQDAHHTVVASNQESLNAGIPVRILTYEAGAIAAIRELLVTKFAGQYHLETYYYPDRTIKSIGVYAPGSDKGTALAYVLKRLEIHPDHVVAIGDNPNDLPMFPHARVRVAMGNATDDVKQQSTAIAPTHDEEGVAWALERFVLQ